VSESLISINALIPVPKQEKILSFLGLMASVREVSVQSDEENKNAGEFLTKIAGMINALEADRKELVAPLKEKTTAIDRRYKEVRDELENGKKVLGAAMAKYHDEQERKRLEAQRKLELEAAEARRKAEAEAEKLKAKAESAREAGKEAVAERAEVKAQIAERTASAIVAPIVANTAKVEGVSFRNKYVVEVENRAEALKALATDPTLSRFLEIDVKGLERWVASLGGEGVPLPAGLRIGVERITAVRGKK